MNTKINQNDLEILKGIKLNLESWARMIERQDSIVSSGGYGEIDQVMSTLRASAFRKTLRSQNIWDKIRYIENLAKMSNWIFKTNKNSPKMTLTYTFESFGMLKFETLKLDGTNGLSGYKNDISDFFEYLLNSNLNSSFSNWTKSEEEKLERLAAQRRADKIASGLATYKQKDLIKRIQGECDESITFEAASEFINKLKNNGWKKINLEEVK